MDEDSFSKLKKEWAESVAGAAPEHKLGGFGASVGEGNRVGAGNWPHTPDNLSKDRGRRIFQLARKTVRTWKRFPSSADPCPWTGCQACEANCPLPVSLPTEAPKSSSLWSANGLRALSFEVRNAIFIQSPSETDSEPILKRFWVQKWSQNRPKINPKSMSVFDVVFCSISYQKIHVTSKPRTGKINKNILAF